MVRFWVSNCFVTLSPKTREKTGAGFQRVCLQRGRKGSGVFSPTNYVSRTPLLFVLVTRDRARVRTRTTNTNHGYFCRDSQIFKIHFCASSWRAPNFGSASGKPYSTLGPRRWSGGTPVR